MRDDEIYVGDIVRVRQWVDMAKEFGIKVVNLDNRRDRCIPINDKHTCFSEEMEEYCGLTFTIREKYQTDAHGYGYRFMESSPFGGWYFVCSEMLEPSDSNKDFDVATDEELLLLLG